MNPSAESSHERGSTLKRCVVELNAAIERQDFETIGAILSPDLVHRRRGLERTLPLLLRNRPRPPNAYAGFRAATEALTERFSAWHARIDGLYCDGDLVIARQTMSGQLRGRFPGADRENPSFEFPMVVTFRFEGERIVEIWALGDELGFWVQMGVDLSKVEAT